MKISLSHRLSVCAGFVAPGDRVADIGCDHGYLSIYLLQKDIASHVYAADIKEGPLHAARSNAIKFGVADRLQLYLSDGAASIPRDFDTMVCAGMGADTMISILQGAPWLQDGRYRLILQCQSKTPSLRRYLSDHGWHIAAESVLRDGRFLYTVMEAVYQKSPALTPGQCWFSPALARNRSPEATQYRQQMILKLQRAVHARGENADRFLAAALTELTEKELFHDNC